MIFNSLHEITYFTYIIQSHVIFFIGIENHFYHNIMSLIRGGFFKNLEGKNRDKVTREHSRSNKGINNFDLQNYSKYYNPNLYVHGDGDLPNRVC